MHSRPPTVHYRTCFQASFEMLFSIFRLLTTFQYTFFQYTFSSFSGPRWALQVEVQAKRKREIDTRNAKQKEFTVWEGRQIRWCIIRRPSNNARRSQWTWRPLERENLKWAHHRSKKGIALNCRPHLRILFSASKSFEWFSRLVRFLGSFLIRLDRLIDANSKVIWFTCWTFFFVRQN